ncbi:MAG: efflux RND transporter periplasmic adaptor subunit [Vicinamibacteraceae bacterium]
MADLKDELAALRIERTPETGKSRWVSWLAALLLLGAAGAGVWFWAFREKALVVEAVAVQERASGGAAGGGASVLNASGYVTARRRATVSSKVTGKVIEVNVEEGMAVKQGQILARLDDATPRAMLQLTQAQAESARRAVTESEVRLAEAKLTLKRRLQLVKDSLSTQAEVDQAQAEVDSVEARIKAAEQAVEVAQKQIALQQTDLDNMIIRAPFSGVALSKDAQPGEMVSPVSAGGGFTRTGISTIVDMGSLEIEVEVNEAYINRVTPKQRVVAVLDAYPDWEIPAHVITMVPTADRQKATVLVRVGFNALDPRILPDMGVKVRFIRDESPDAAKGAPIRPLLLVPKNAIRTTGSDTVVFVVKGQVVEQRAIKAGGADGDRVEVITGLQSGERVVAPVPDTLKDGTAVSVKP